MHDAVAGKGAGQVGPDGARVQRDGGDLGVPLGHLAGEQNVGKLALAVASPGHLLRLGRLERVEDDAARHDGGADVGKGREDDDAHVRVWLLGGRLEEQRGEEAGEEGVADVVGAELDLVALLGLAGWGGHDAGVEHQDVEPVCLLGHALGGVPDGVERGQVQGERLDGGIGHLLLDLVDGFLGAFGAARGEPDLLGVTMLGQLEDRLLAEAAVAARHHNHFTLQRRDVVRWVERHPAEKEVVDSHSCLSLCQSVNSGCWPGEGSCTTIRMNAKTGNLVAMACRRVL